MKVQRCTVRIGAQIKARLEPALDRAVGLYGAGSSTKCRRLRGSMPSRSVSVSLSSRSMPTRRRPAGARPRAHLLTLRLRAFRMKVLKIHHQCWRISHGSNQCWPEEGASQRVNALARQRRPGGCGEVSLTEYAWTSLETSVDRAATRSSVDRSASPPARARNDFTTSSSAARMPGCDSHADRQQQQ